MRQLYIAILTFVMVGCTIRPKVVSPVPGNIKLNDRVEVDSILPRNDIIVPSNGFFSTDFKYQFFGKIGNEERLYDEDTLLFPPIPGLIHKSVYTLCPADTCFAEFVVLALRCPPKRQLLRWVSDTVFAFVTDCPIGHALLENENSSLDFKKKYFESARGICDYYMGQLSHIYDDWRCKGTGDHGSFNEQAGLLIADCWSHGDLYTFYRIDWYDWMSCGNNSRESYVTVDAKTGKKLGLADLVDSDKYDDLSVLMMPRLVNGGGELLIEQNSYFTKDDKNVLYRADGCALIEDGLIIYFFPYNLGSGADGQYEAVIPYSELQGILYDRWLCLLGRW